MPALKPTPVASATVVEETKSAVVIPTAPITAAAVAVGGAGGAGGAARPKKRVLVKRRDQSMEVAPGGTASGGAPQSAGSTVLPAIQSSTNTAASRPAPIQIAFGGSLPGAVNATSAIATPSAPPTAPTTKKKKKVLVVRRVTEADAASANVVAGTDIIAHSLSALTQQINATGADASGAGGVGSGGGAALRAHNVLGGSLGLRLLSEHNTSNSGAVVPSASAEPIGRKSPKAKSSRPPSVEELRERAKRKEKIRSQRALKQLNYGDRLLYVCSSRSL